MSDVVFVTGNQNKADYMAKLLGIPISYRKLDLEEIQSMNLSDIAKYKAQQAYEHVKQPVLVEDQGLYLPALNGFPGPFIKFLVENSGVEALCRMLDGFNDRTVIARTVFAYYDGNEITLFESELQGEIAQKPRGKNGWGWDPVFCPDGYDGKTRAELSEADNYATYLQIKPIVAVRDFLQKKDK